MIYSLNINTIIYMTIMEKKSICTQIPDSIKDDLDNLSRQTGRNKNVLVAASLHNFLKVDSVQQENMIKKYLNDYPK